MPIFLTCMCLHILNTISFSARALQVFKLSTYNDPLGWGQILVCQDWTGFGHKYTNMNGRVMAERHIRLIDTDFH